MRILHIEHGGLPDLRVEKSALTMKKQGHDLIFLGGRKSQYQNLGAFDEMHHIPLGNDLDLALNPFLKRKWIKKINRINPDIIHAHNILVAHFILDTEYPAVYDDHEYWSRQVSNYRDRKMPRGLASRPLMFMIPRWEKKLIKRYPTFTTTEDVAREHRTIGRWVKPLRNVPLEQQIRDLPSHERTNELVYSGCDFNRPRFQTHRNMRGLKRILNFRVICGFQHREMMEELVKFKIGLTPMLLHSLHYYSDPNRNYEYQHAGLQVVANRGIKRRFKNDPYVHSFNDYEDILEVIDSISEKDPMIIMKHARKKYLWEHQERVIHEAYKRA